MSQHVSGIIMPIFRRTKALLLQLVRSVTSGKTQIIAVKYFLCSKLSWEDRVCLRMLCVNGCSGVWLVSASYVFRSGVSGAGVLMYALCLFNGKSVVQVLLGVTRGRETEVSNKHLIVASCWSSLFIVSWVFSTWRCDWSNCSRHSMKPAAVEASSVAMYV